MVLLQLGKENQAENISDLTSSSPDIGSGESSLSNGHSLSDVISDWKRELEEKNCELRDKIALVQSLENELKHRNLEICDVRDRCKSVELDRDKSCQMVNMHIHIFSRDEGKVKFESYEKRSRDFPMFLFLSADGASPLKSLQHIQDFFYLLFIKYVHFITIHRLVN